MSRVIYMVNSRFMAQRYKLFFKLPNIFSVFLSNEESPVSRLGNFYITYIIIHVRSAREKPMRALLRWWYPIADVLSWTSEKICFGALSNPYTEDVQPLSFLEAGLLTSFRRMPLPAFNDTLLINKMPTAVDLLHANDKGTYSCGTVGDSHPIPF